MIFSFPVSSLSCIIQNETEKTVNMQNNTPFDWLRFIFILYHLFRKEGRHIIMSKTAIITGGSRGIGKALSLKLGEMGYNVVINYRSESSKALSDDIAATLEKEYGVKTLVVKADVSRYEDCEALVKAAVDHFGDNIDVLVNNTNLADLTEPSMIEDGEKTVLACAEKLGVSEVITAGKRKVLEICRLQTPVMGIKRYMVPEWMEQI